MSEKEASGRQRSPNYPYLSLEDAVEKIRIIYNRDKLAPTSADVVVGHLGYNKLHGTSRRVLSSLKEYGLLEELSDQRLRVSDLAYKILNSDFVSPSGLKLLKEAALRPIIFFNIIEEYKGELPSDPTLSSYLVLERGFTPDGAASFIKVLRDTTEFANINRSDFEEKTEEKPVPQADLFGSFFGNQKMQAQEQTSLQQPNHQFVGAADASNLPSIKSNETILNFKISRNSEARVIFSGQVTQEAIAKLAALLDFSKDVYPTQAELEQPKQATWRNKDYDQPVKVTGELGEKDGKKFYSIEGSTTGISEDELDFEGGQ